MIILILFLLAAAFIFGYKTGKAFAETDLSGEDELKDFFNL